MVDALVSGASVERRVGSSPILGTRSSSGLLFFVPRIGLDNRWHLGRLILLGCYLLPQIIVLMEQVCLKISFRHIVPNPDNLRLKHPRYGLLSATAVVRVRYL